MKRTRNSERVRALTVGPWIGEFYSLVLPLHFINQMTWYDGDGLHATLYQKVARVHTDGKYGCQTDWVSQTEV